MKINGVNPNNTLNFTSRLTYEEKSTGFRREVEQDYNDMLILEYLNDTFQNRGHELIIDKENQRIALLPDFFLSTFDNGIDISYNLKGETDKSVKLTLSNENVFGGKESRDALLEAESRINILLDKKEKNVGEMKKLGDLMQKFADRLKLYLQSM